MQLQEMVSSTGQRPLVQPPTPAFIKSAKRRHEAMDAKHAVANKLQFEQASQSASHQRSSMPRVRLWKAVDAISDVIDRRIVRTWEKFDAKFFGFMFKMVSDMAVQAAATPHMPKRVREAVLPLVESMTTHLADNLLASLVEERSRAHSSYREMRVHYWAKFPKVLGWNWLRARILYALMPADGNVWTLLKERNALLFVINALLIIPQTAVPMFSTPAVCMRPCARPCAQPCA